MAEPYDSEKETFMGIPRTSISWFPTIDYNKCDYCMECAKFCPHDVYEQKKDAEIKLIVKNPNNCVVFCRSCSKACPLDALSFPDKKEVLEKIKKMRKE